MQSPYNLATFKANWKSGLTLALISIPLAISIAVVSGMNPVAGIITAMWAGSAAAIFGGSDFNVIAPTGALSGIIAAFALQEGAGAVPMLAITAGVFILIAYALKLERYLVFVPSSVIHGFIMGIAAIVCLNQIGFALGLQSLPKHMRLLDRVIEVAKHLHETSFWALTLFLLFFIALIFLTRIIRKIPGVIILSPLGIMVGYFMQRGFFPFHLETLGTKYGAIEPVLVQLPMLYYNKHVVIIGAVIAFISIIETILAAKIADGMTKTRHNQRRELIGAGMANLASGLAGGFPVTAALALTTSNIRAGATSRVSSLISAGFVALGSLFFLRYFAYMPMAIIAAILVFVALRMVEQEHIARLWRRDTTQFLIVLIVAGITVYEDPTIGILVGSVIALLSLVNKLTQSFAQIAVHCPLISKKELDIAKRANILIYTFKGKLVYLNSQSHVVRFQSDFKDYESIVLVLDDLYFIDSDGVDSLEEIIELIQVRGQRVVLVISQTPIIQLVCTGKLVADLKKDGLVHDSVVDALEKSEHSSAQES